MKAKKYTTMKARKTTGNASSRTKKGMAKAKKVSNRGRSQRY